MGKHEKTPELIVVGPNDDLDLQVVVQSTVSRLGPYDGSFQKVFTKNGIIISWEVLF